MPKVNQRGEQTQMKSLLDRAADKCHTYGWLINLAVMAVMFAYFMGGINSSINSLNLRIGMLERAVFFQTRGGVIAPQGGLPPTYPDESGGGLH